MSRIVYTVIMNGGNDVSLEQKVEKALAHRHMSKSEVAAAIGMSRKTFQRKLKQGAFTVAELEKLSQAMGARFSMTYVFEDDTRI